MPKLHALLIAINNYHPESRVGSLRGCINDINDFEAYLQSEYQDLTPTITKLLDEAATYDTVIEQFEKCLIQEPQAGDTVVLYYSGHGSQWTSAGAFEQFDGNAKDETMVCYDSRLPGHYDLADKELAALIAQIKMGVHTVIILDSCHSGSATRTTEEYELGAKRFTGGTTQARPIATYYKGFYQKMLTDTGELKIPNRAHLLLAACDRSEVAWETTTHRGAFSAALLSVLKQSNNLAYRDVFVKTRGAVRKYNTLQSPQFEAVSSFNVNEAFIRNTKTEYSNRLPIEFSKKNRNWFINQGALQGLPTEVAQIAKVKINVFEKGATEPLQTATLLDVKLNYSTLGLDAAPNLDLEGELIFLPVPAIYLHLEGSAADKATFLKAYTNDVFIGLVAEEAIADFILKIDGKIGSASLQLYKKGDRNLIHGVQGLNDKSVEYILEILSRVADWQKTYYLQNKNTQFKPNDVELLFFEETRDGNLIPYIGDVLNFEYKKDAAGKWEEIWYRLKIKNNTRKELNVAVLYLDDNFAIQELYAKKILGQTEEEIISEGSISIFNDAVDFDKDFFKVLVSSEPLDSFMLLQEGFKVGEIAASPEGLSNNRGISRRAQPEDWFTKILQINIIRQKDRINTQKTDLFGGQISIKAHSSFTANLGVLPAQSQTRSAESGSPQIPVFQDKNLSLLSFGESTRSTEQHNILQFNDIKGEAALANEPLEITLTQPLNADEFILPITFDGEFVLPFGDSQKDENGNTKIIISSIPDVATADENAAQTRSLGRALKMAFLKIAFKQSGDALFKLRVGVFTAEGEFFYNENADVNAAIRGAKKILLAIHGIIGSTESIATQMEFAKKEHGYDLILTYDYENLNSDLIDVAKFLKNALAAGGISETDDKQLDLVVHSMGGLVARTFIETLGCHKWVDNLIMFGTPNGGSRFGKIADYQNFAIVGLTLAMNFLKPLTAQLAGLLFGLKASKNLTRTLDQMRQDSEFTQNLYTNEIGNISTKYHIIAGDMTNYSAQGDSKVAAFIDKILMSVGNTLYKNINNDIAVATEDIMKVPATRNAAKYVVDCHHLNYFKMDAAMDVFRKILTAADTNTAATAPPEPPIIPIDNEEKKTDEDINLDKNLGDIAKSIVITGASTGIGYSSAKAFLKAGYLVFGSVRNRGDAERLQGELGENFVPLIFDVTDDTGITAAATTVANFLNGKGLTGLINNAGIALGGVMQYMAMSDIEKQFEVNVFGLLRVTKAFLPLLGGVENAAFSPGRIVNISSVGGQIASPFVGPYVGTKFAVEGLSHSLRRELLLWGIDVIIIGPGAVKTPIWDKGTQVTHHLGTAYEKILSRFTGYMQKAGEKGLDSDAVGERILTIFEKKKPKVRYALIPGNILTEWIIPKLLPHRWLDKIIGKQTGLN